MSNLLTNFLDLVPQAKQIMGDFKPNSAADIKKFLAGKGLQGGWIDKAIEKAVPAAKLAKTFGPAKVKDVLRNVDIDSTAKTIKDLVNPSQTPMVDTSATISQYADYDRRNISSFSYSGKAKDLPD